MAEVIYRPAELDDAERAADLNETLGYRPRLGFISYLKRVSS